MTGIERHFEEEQYEKVVYFAKFCDLVDNDTDRIIMPALGISLSPYPVEHTHNVARLQEAR